MLQARSTMSNNGRIVIPAAMRKELNLKNGEELILKVESGEIHIISYKKAVKKAQALVRKYNKKNKSLTNMLFKMRKQEFDKEENDNE